MNMGVCLPFRLSAIYEDTKAVGSDERPKCVGTEVCRV